MRKGEYYIVDLFDAKAKIEHGQGIKFGAIINSSSAGDIACNEYEIVGSCHTYWFNEEPGKAIMYGSSLASKPLTFARNEFNNPHDRSQNSRKVISMPDDVKRVNVICLGRGKGWKYEGIKG